MATQAYPYLAITDGTTTVTIQDGLGGVTNWPLNRGTWAPAVTGLRNNQLGGRGPYSEIAEELTINIRGADAAAAMANVGTLAQLLDQAQRFTRGESGIAPVMLKYAPQGSTIASTAAPLQCVILGRTGGDETTGVNLSSRFGDVGMIKEISGVKVKFLRRGLWLEQQTSNASVSGVSADVLTVGLVNATAIASPTECRIGPFTSGFIGPTVVTPSMLIVTNTATNLVVVEGESLATVTGWSTVGDSASNARGGSVKRLNPASGSGLSLPTTVSLPGTFTARRVALWAAVRDNSPLITFELQISLSGADGVKVRLPSVFPPINSTNPQIVFCGIAQMPVGVTTLTIQGARDASGTTETLDIDYFVFVGLDEQYDTSVIAFPDASDLSTFFAASVSVALTVSPGTADRDRPFAGALGLTGSTERRFSYSGDPSIFMRGQFITGIWLAPTSGKWRAPDLSGFAASVTLTTRRGRAFLTPQ